MFSKFYLFTDLLFNTPKQCILYKLNNLYLTLTRK